MRLLLWLVTVGRRWIPLYFTLAMFLIIPDSLGAASNGVICLTEFPLNPGTLLPFGIIHGPDDNIWFFESLEAGGYALARVTAQGHITDFPIPGTPVRMTAGPDGNLWYTRSDVGAVSRMTLQGITTTFPISGTSPFGITVGPDDNLWITEASGNQVERLNLSGQVPDRFSIPTVASDPREIVTGADGNLWFIQYGTHQIGRTTTTGTMTEFPITSSEIRLTGITVGPDGNVWFTETSTCSLTNPCSYPQYYAKIAPSGTLTEIPVPTGVGYAYNIMVGPDGNLWSFNHFYHILYGFSMAKISPDGPITEYCMFQCISTTYSSYTWGEFLVSGPDNTLWLTETNNHIAKFNAQSVGHCYFVPLVRR
jgi:virginiamycin B lyase